MSTEPDLVEAIAQRVADLVCARLGIRPQTPEPSPVAPPNKGMEIVQEVASQWEIPVDEIISPSRVSHVVAARDEAMARIRTELGWSYPRIGRAFKRDHTSVIQAVRRAGGAQ